MRLPNSRLWLSLCLTGWFLGSVGEVCWGQEERSVKLSQKTVLTFATVEEGQKLVGVADDFIQRLGDLEIQLRMRSADPVTRLALLEQLQAGVIEWNQNDIQIVEMATRTIRERIQDYNLPFPPQIHLIRVSAEFGENAPHCRGASIILPDSFFARPSAVPRILAHELFHVLSSHNPKLRDRLYRIIHFERTDEVSLPAALQAQRLTNPDAPSNEHVIHLTIEGTKTLVVPVTLTKTNEYRSGGIFANLDFKLMVLEEKDGKFVPKLDNGSPQLLRPQQVPDYGRHIGRNTSYIIHPEETLADNFWMMVLGSDRIQDAWVIDEMKAVLKK